MKNLNCGIWKVSRLFLIEKIRCAYSKTFRQCERIFGEGTVSSEKSSPSHTRLHSLCFKGNCWQFLCCVFLDNFYVHKRTTCFWTWEGAYHKGNNSHTSKSAKKHLLLRDDCQSGTEGLHTRSGEEEALKTHWSISLKL